MSWIFDGLIGGFLILAFVAVIVLQRKRRQGLALVATDLAIVGLSIAWCVVFYGSFIEPRFIVLNDQTIDISETPQSSIHLAVVSDIHVGDYRGEADVQRLLDTINQAHPDAVLLLGDFVSLEADEAKALAPFTTITEVYPTYAVLGNHDYQLTGSRDQADWENANAIADALTSFGVTVLRNEGLVIGDRLWLAGAEEYWTGTADIALTLQGRPQDFETILLTHNPDLIQQISEQDDIDLVLAGHTHGGQIRLPFIGPVPELPTELGRAYDKGLFDYNGTPLFITSGAGESGPRARLFNPPEIVSLFVGY